MIKQFLKVLSFNSSLDKEKTRLFDDHAVDFIIGTPSQYSLDTSYHLTKTAIHTLSDYKPIGEEILNAYIKLLSSKRC